MRVVLQRVARASVDVDGRTAGSIGPGLLALAAVRRGDDDEDVAWIAGKIADLRIFPDAAGRMNRSVVEAGGAILLVSQFTLYGDVRKGRRPSFTGSARPEEAVPALAALERALAGRGLEVATGEFGAHMDVALLNDGPVTLILDSAERRRGGGGAAAPGGASAGGASDSGTVRLGLLGVDGPLAGEPLVLASASPRRRDLLREVGLDFEVDPSDVDETLEPGRDPAELAAALAVRKAEAVASRRPDRWVLAADTIVALGDRLLGKPEDDAEALEMLRALAGRAHRVVTGVCVARGDRGVRRATAVTTTVRFRRCADEELRRYVATGEPFGKAGAYAIQGLGGLLVAGIDGDWSNVVGLPVGATLDLLDGAVAAGRGEGGTA